MQIGPEDKDWEQEPGPRSGFLPGFKIDNQAPGQTLQKNGGEVRSGMDVISHRSDRQPDQKQGQEWVDPLTQVSLIDHGEEPGNHQAGHLK